ncbi:unnamed protein product [Adineta ricciae]|uniref:B box-type domain-containing protein n=1 Tax=Adineta ricciae TaxID=249248 RepID=A0A813P7X8_ADIRI|nr:unnamed protein product [Adineta ricciae]CAF1136172.1 unnamed protein product [Adineta ricciae]
MSSTKRIKNGCTACGKMVGVFACRGCSGNFCLSHTKDHRDHLQRSLNDIIHDYEQIKRNINGQTVEQRRSSLVEQINEWEQESIKKVRELAGDIRQELEITVQRRTDNLKEKLELLKQQFDKAQQDGGYYENDLKEWTSKLNELQRTYIDQEILKIDEDSHSLPLVSRISLNDYQLQSYHHRKQHQNHIDGSDDGEIVSSSYQRYSQPEKEKVNHQQQNVESAESKKVEYAFKLEGYQNSTSILFGIISESAADSEDENNNPTFFGWGSKDRVYFGDQSQENYDNYRTDFQSDDICVLTIDPDQDKISMKNQRTNAVHELRVNREKCALPWQVCVRLYNKIN